MTVTVESEVGSLVSRALADIRSSSGVDVAFAASVRPHLRDMRIDQTVGARTAALSGLVISSGAGLGGKALALGHATFVVDYLSANGITHAYDFAVEREALRTVAAVPVTVGRSIRVVAYLGLRESASLGERWLDSLGPRIAQLQREIEIAEEVARRMRATPPKSANDVVRPEVVQRVAQQLMSIARGLDDRALGGQLEDLSRCLAGGHPGHAAVKPVRLLTAREIEVVRLAASGAGNADIADELDLVLNTVKSYLKSAMRKLGVSNRVQAANEARRLGLID